MSGPLLVQEEDPVNLNGSIDAAGDLQLAHGSDSLADHSQTLHAEHESLNNPSNTIRIKLIDFRYGGDNWEITATHDPGTGTVTWSRGTNHAYYDFGPMSSELNVTVEASNDEDPPKQRVFKLKTLPTDSQ